MSLSEEERDAIIEALVRDFVSRNDGLTATEIADAVGFDGLEVLSALYGLEKRGSVVGGFVPSLSMRVWSPVCRRPRLKRTL